MMRRLTPAVGPAVVSLALLACGTGDVSHASAIIVRDSSGIRIVENRAAATAAAGRWTLEPTPTVEIGASPNDPGQQLFRVGDVVRMTNGAIAVTNEGSDEVLVYDSLGRFLRTLGRPGEGPGELSRLSGLYRCAGDTLVVDDFDRVHVFDIAGSFVRSERVISSAALGVRRVQGISRDCSSYLLSSRALAGVPSLGEVGRRQLTLVWSDLSGDASLETVATFAGREYVGAILSDMHQAIPLPWGQDAVWAVGDDRLYLGLTGRAEIRVFQQGRGLVRIVRWATGPRAVTAADRRLYAQKRAYWLERFPQLAEYIPELDDYPRVPGHMPAFSALHVDERGRLWVREYPRRLAGRPDLYEFGANLWERPPPDAAPERWLAFDRTGQLIAIVTVPPGLAIRAVHDGFVLGVWRDERHVERVRLHGVRAGTGDPTN